MSRKTKIDQAIEELEKGLDFLKRKQDDIVIKIALQVHNLETLKSIRDMKSTDKRTTE